MPNSPIIKNHDQLETTDLRRKVLDIVEAGIERVLPSTIMQSALSFDPLNAKLSVFGETYELKGRLFVVGGGKASGLMAQELEGIIGNKRIEAGIISEKARPEEFQNSKIKILQAGHPIPDNRGIAAVTEILSLKQKYSIGKEDIVLCLISGGGSSLLPFPIEGVSLTEKQEVTRLLLRCGANINEVNTVRKHLSGIKGGRLAQYFAPARVLSLILSDVIGNDLSVIASGLTYPDESTFSGAQAVLEKYHLLDCVPSSIRSILHKGCRGEIEETPKFLENTQNYIIGDVRLALESMAEKARTIGFKPLVITHEQTGDTANVASRRAKEIINGAYSGYNALLLGGETTPTLPSNPGKGGRNQHYAACTLLKFQKYLGEWVLASVGTDGSDYIPEAAGAIVDNESLISIKKDFPDIRKKIERYDSYDVLNAAGNSLIVTGNTHTNVGDIIIYLFPMDNPAGQE